MKIHDLLQGSPEWHAFRLEHFGASEISAVLGLSKTTTRAELLRMKHTGMAREYSDWVQTHILDHGHEVEALARPHVEAMIADDLYAVTCSDGKLSASCDGLTLGQEVAWEHKQFAAELFAQVTAGNVPDEHMPQCQQVLMVTGAQMLIFTVSDGTPQRMVHAKVRPDPAWFARIRAGWAQFAADLATYTPPQPAPVITAAPVETLPAVLVRMSGALTVESNLDAFGAALRGFIERIPARPTTDQEFADTDAACKALKRAEDALGAEEDRALAGMADVEKMRRLVADLKTLARVTRLAREKMVEARKLEIRTEEVRRGATALAAFVADLNVTIGRPLMPASASQADFGLAIKGLRSLDSVRAAIDQKLADAKIEASAIQQRITANLRRLTVDNAEHAFLFPDVGTLVLKAADDLGAVIGNRIAEHQAKEAKRLEAERERIRVEEQAKAQAAAAVPVVAPPVAIPAAAVAPAVVAAPATPTPKQPNATRAELNRHLDGLGEADLKRVLSFVVSRFVSQQQAA